MMYSTNDSKSSNVYAHVYGDFVTPSDSPKKPTNPVITPLFGLTTFSRRFIIAYAVFLRKQNRGHTFPEPTGPMMESSSPALTEQDTLLRVFSWAAWFHLAVTSYTVKPEF